MKRLLKGFTALILIVFSQLLAQAQTTGAIAGTITDSNGAIVPNASIVIKGNGGQQYNAVTADNGTFRIPAVGSGIYTVTVTAANFKKVVIENVKVDIGTPTTVDATLQAGNIEETVTVTSGGEVLQTQTATVSTTITGRQITETPLTSRDALDLVTLLPGTATVGRPRQSSINGLPKGSLSITIDGVDVQDNLLRSSDGFFTYVRPRLDAVEEVNVSTATPGAESSGDGAVQIKFVTKRGTNDYRGNLFWQYRAKGLNSNYWWNNTLGVPRNPLILNQYGGSFGGPIPHMNFGEGVPFFNSGKDRAFFFVNYEEFRIPESTLRTRRILNPGAQAGGYTYVDGTGTTRTINVLSVAGSNPNTADPTINSILTSIRSTVGQGTLQPVGLNYQDFSFVNKNNAVRKFLALRFDVNLTKKHSLENVTNRQTFRSPVDFLNSVDPSFPDFPSYGSQDSDRYSNTTALRSTLTKNIINEARFSFSGGLSLFRGGLTTDVFDFQGGFNLNPNVTNLNTTTQSLALSSFTASNSNNRRVSPTFDFSDNLTWLFGNHSLALGGQYKLIKLRTASINQAVPNVTFGFGPASGASADPARGIFNTTNFPGASTTQLGEAAALYALLTGRINSVAGSAYLTDNGTYGFLADQLQRAKLTTFGLYAQDSWRMKPNLTINFGLRWQPQSPFEVTSANYARASDFTDVFGVSGEGNIFKPGTLTGKVPTFLGTEAGYKAFDTDWNNFAPSVGVVWSPNFKDGFLRKVFGGNGRSVFRGGYSTSFVREGTNIVLSILGSNPGSLLSATRSTALGNLPSGTLLRNLVTNGYTPAPFLNTPAYPLTGGASDSTNVFDPNLKTGSVKSWTVGYQRQLDNDTVIELRYVGNRGTDLWRQYNINEYNTIENGFADEFRLAQANLIANNLAGGSRANSFAYFGPNTGTNPLPIILAHAFGAGTMANPFNPTNTAQYTATFFTDGTLRNLLSPLNPNVLGFASNIDGIAGQRTNFLNAGNVAGASNYFRVLPSSNFFLVNPTTRGGAFMVDNSAHSYYDAFVVELRRRLSRGLLVQGSYTYAKSMTDAFASSAVLSSNFVSLRDKELNKTLSPFDIRHAFKVSSVYELPFGTGRMFFGNSNKLTNAFIGGWSIISALRWQSGTPINFGNVQLVGITAKELEKELGVYYNVDVPTSTAGTGSRIVPATYLPADIIKNTNLAFNFGAPTGRFIAPAGYNNCIQRYSGECGFSNLVLHGPGFWKMDLTLSKKVKFDEKRNVEMRAAFYNAFNNHPFRVGGWAADVVNVSGLAAAERLGGLDFGQYKNGTVYQDTSTTNDPGGRIIELILRINF
jgi:hypothetical protein